MGRWDGIGARGVGDLQPAALGEELDGHGDDLACIGRRRRRERAGGRAWESARARWGAGRAAGGSGLSLAREAGQGKRGKRCASGAQRAARERACGKERDRDRNMEAATQQSYLATKAHRQAVAFKL